MLENQKIHRWLLITVLALTIGIVRAESVPISGIIIRWNVAVIPLTSVIKLSEGRVLRQQTILRKEDTALTRVEVPPDQSMAELLRWIRSLPGVIYAEPDYPVRMSQTPDDSSLDQQWYLASINAFNAWDLATDCSSVLIATVDTGVDLDHPDLIANLWVNPDEIAGNGFDDDGNGIVDDIHGFNAIKNDGSPDDDNGHGTHIAGVIAASANNSLGTAGVCWSAQLMAIKFLDRFGGGSVSDAVKGIQYALDNKPENTPMIINNSWVIGQYSQALEDVLRLAESSEVFVTVAAGNTGADNDTAVVYPTFFRRQFDNIISVANVDQQDNLYVGSKGSSNYGVTSVDMAAPGKDIYSTYKNDAYLALTGTSMATPMVTAAAALLMQQRPGISAKELKAALMGSANRVDTLKGSLVVPGVLNIQRLLENAYATPSMIYRVQGDSGEAVGAGSQIEVTGFGLENTAQVFLGDQSIGFEVIDSGKIRVDLPFSATDALLQTDASNELLVKIVARPPSELNLQLNSLQQPLLSWNSDSNIDFVEIERAQGGSSYQALETVVSPQAVYVDTGGDAATSCYRLRSGFSYTDPYTLGSREKYSEYSSSTGISASSEAVLWSTQFLGSIAKGLEFSEPLYARSLNSNGFEIMAAQPLPPGIELSAHGLLAGMVDEVGDYRFDVLLTVPDGCPEQKTITLKVTESSDSRFLDSQLRGQYSFRLDQGMIGRLQSRDIFSWEAVPEVSNYEVIDLTIDLSSVEGVTARTALLSASNMAFNAQDEFRLFAMDEFDDWVELAAGDGLQKSVGGLNWTVEDNGVFDHDDNVQKLRLKMVVSLKPSASAQSGADNRCFIASALYTSDADSGRLRTLREFRDKALAKSWTGRMFIELYYRASPELAWWLLQRPEVAKTVKILLNVVLFIMAYLDYLALLALLVLVAGSSRFFLSKIHMSRKLIPEY